MYLSATWLSNSAQSGGVFSFYWWCPLKKNSLQLWWSPFFVVCVVFFLYSLGAIAKTSSANSQVTEVYSIVLRVPQLSLWSVSADFWLWCKMGTQGHSSASVLSDCVAPLAGKAIVSPIELFQALAKVDGLCTCGFIARPSLSSLDMSPHQHYTVLRTCIKFLSFEIHVFLFPVYSWKHVL